MRLREVEAVVPLLLVFADWAEEEAEVTEGIVILRCVRVAYAKEEGVEVVTGFTCKAGWTGCAGGRRRCGAAAISSIRFDSIRFRVLATSRLAEARKVEKVAQRGLEMCRSALLLLPRKNEGVNSERMVGAAMQLLLLKMSEGAGRRPLDSCFPNDFDSCLNA